MADIFQGLSPAKLVDTTLDCFCDGIHHTHDNVSNQETTLFNGTGLNRGGIGYQLGLHLLHTERKQKHDQQPPPGELNLSVEAEQSLPGSHGFPDFFFQILLFHFCSTSLFLH